MVDEQAEDGMIEIGDPSDETTAAEPPPRVVIEYRERGVPWMMIPPIIVLSAVASLVLYFKFAPPPRRGPVSANSRQNPAEPSIAAETPGRPSPAEARPEPASPFELETGTSPAPVTTPIDLAREVVETEPPVDPAPFPRVQGLGFDPGGLKDPEPPVDQALAPAAGPQDQPDREAMPAIEPGARDRPEEIDPNILPVDPREARRRRQERLVEARKKAEADRGRFHAELKAICRKPGEKLGPAIDELCKKYGMDVEPAIQAEATRLLSGPAAGVDRSVRIHLLRSLGYSEPLILDDIFRNQGRFDDGTARDGARSKQDLMYRSALLLLGYPPSRVAAPARPVSTSRAAR